MAKLHVIAEPGKHEIVMTRVFNAPRDLVYQVFTDPKMIAQWWGPRYLTTTVEKMDLRHGGLWRYVQKNSEGHEYAFKGVYHEIVPSERLVYTIEFEGMPGHIGLETIIFEEQDGKTTLIDKGLFQSVEDRDGMLQSGMEGGATESMDRLAELVEKA